MTERCATSGKADSRMSQVPQPSLFESVNSEPPRATLAARSLSHPVKNMTFFVQNETQLYQNTHYQTKRCYHKLASAPASRNSEI